MAMKRKAAKMAMSGADDSKTDLQMSEEEELRDPKLLLHKKRQLVSKIREYRDDKRQLEARIGRMVIKQKRYDSHLAMIDRHWNGLDAGLKAVLSRVDLTAEIPAGEMVPESKEPSFLNHLLKKDVCGQHGSDSETHEIDSSLEAKCSFTTDVLKRVAASLTSGQRFEQSDPKNEALTSRIDALQAQNAVLNTERIATEAKMVRYRQMVGDLKMQNESMEDQLEAERLSVKKMTIRLQDSETHLKDAAIHNSADHTSVSSGGLSTASSSGTSERDDALADAEYNAKERLNETTRMQEQVLKLEQEAMHLKQQVIDPSDEQISESSQYRALAFEYKAMDTNHTRLQEKYERLQQETAAGNTAAQEKSTKLEAATKIARDALVAKLKDAENLAQTANDRYEEARERLERQGLRPDSSTQIKELNLLVSSLRKELDRVKAELKERPRTDQAVDAKHDVAVKLEASEMKVLKLTTENAKLADKLAETQKGQRQSVEKEKDLKILLEVLQSSSKDSRELTEVRTAERTATSALAQAKSDLNAVKAELEALKDGKAKLRSADLSQCTPDAAGELELQVESLQIKLKIQKEEEEGLVKELDEIGEAFEEMQEQNARLLNQLKEKDDENFRLMSTRLKEQSKHAALEDIGRAQEAKQSALTEKLAVISEVLRKTEASLKQCQEQLGKTKQELGVTTSVADQCRAQTQTAVDKLMEKQRTFEIVEKQLKSAKIGHDAALVDKQKAYTKAARLKEDYDSLKRRYDRIRSAHTSNGNDEFLEEELRVTKMRLKCSVENGAWKEVIIARDGCYHMFSRKCTDALIKNRNRKCPICNQRFDVTQVVPIHGLAPE